MKLIILLAIITLASTIGLKRKAKRLPVDDKFKGDHISDIDLTTATAIEKEALTTRKKSKGKGTRRIKKATILSTTDATKLANSHDEKNLFSTDPKTGYKLYKSPDGYTAKELEYDAITGAYTTSTKTGHVYYGIEDGKVHHMEKIDA
jgi:hypothetical protein